MDVELHLLCQALCRLSDIVYYVTMQVLVCFTFSSHSVIVYSYGHVPIGGKGVKIWPTVGIGGQWAVRVLQRATPTVTRDIRL